MSHSETLPQSTPDSLASVSDESSAIDLQSDLPVPLPGVAGGLFVSSDPSSSIPVIADDRAIARLLELIIRKSGHTPYTLAKEMGLSNTALSQYCQGYRRPGLRFFLKVCAAAGWEMQVVRRAGARL
jgi:DNA-binding phage protein